MDGYNPWKFFNDNRELLSSRQSQHCVTVRYEQGRFCGKLIQPPGFDGLQPLRNSGLQLPRTGSFLAKNVGDIINFQPKYPNTHWCRYPGGLWCRILKCHDRIGHLQMVQVIRLCPWVWGPPLVSLGMSTVSQSWEAPVWKQTSWGLESGDSSWNSPDHKHFI